MITLLFEKQGVYFNIVINNGMVWYYDKLHGDLWDGPLQYYPPDPNAELKVLASRNRIPHYFIEYLRIDAKELEELKNAKSDEELRYYAIKDALDKGCKFIKEEK